MRKNTWTEEEILFLRNNYPKYGTDYCVKKLNYNKGKIHGTAHKLGLKQLSETKSILLSKPANKCNINPNLFYYLDNKEVVYILGLIWADGFLNRSKSGHVSTLGFTMVKEDVDDLKSVINSIGKWNCYERKQTVKTWKPSMNVLTNNKRIYDYLVDNDYDKKSYISADKILNKIPDNLKHYFYRGLSDGDGCFYYYKTKIGSTLRQFALVSTYEQDWSYFEDLCIVLKIKYNIKRSKNKKSSSSVIRITNKDGIIKLGNYIYNDFQNDKIGLIRKYNKFKLITNAF